MNEHLITRIISHILWNIERGTIDKAFGDFNYDKPTDTYFVLEFNLYVSRVLLEDIISSPLHYKQQLTNANNQQEPTETTLDATAQGVCKEPKGNIRFALMEKAKGYCKGG